MAACLVLDEGGFNKKTPEMLVRLLAQSMDSLKEPASLSSIGM